MTKACSSTAKYGKEVEVAFYGSIRAEAKFDSVDALVERMRVDVEEARKILAESGAAGSRP